VRPLARRLGAPAAIRAGGAHPPRRAHRPAGAGVPGRRAPGHQHRLRVGARARRRPALASVASITLLDQDDGALHAASRALLTDTTTAISLLHRPVRDLLAGSCRLELGQDVIYPLGLYDYLPASTAATLTSRLWEAVGPGGLLVVGNFAQGAQNDRAFLKAALDWWLMYRTQLSQAQPHAGTSTARAPGGDSGSGKHQIRSLVLYVDLVGSRPIWPAHVGWPLGLDGSRRVLSDRLGDQADDQARGNVLAPFRCAGQALDDLGSPGRAANPTSSAQGGGQAAASVVGSTGYWDRQAFMPPWSASACWKPSLWSCSAARALVCSRGQVQYRT
jgi:hypothetical protein